MLITKDTGIFTGNKDMMNVFQLVFLLAIATHKSVRNGNPFMAWYNGWSELVHNKFKHELQENIYRNFFTLSYTFERISST